MLAAATVTLEEIFLQLAALPSPAGSERAVADYIIAFLTEVGLQPREDASAATTAAGSGNISVVVSGSGNGLPILIGAHMDTVAVQGPVVPEVANGIVRSQGETILGADDKAACAVLLVLLRELATAPAAGTVECVFTTSEEIGLLGAKALDLGMFSARAGFVFDSEGVPGTIVTCAPSLKKLMAEFHGLAAHAGIAPDQGRSAIVAAARAIATMPLGRIDEETTANVGVIDGGAATNIVPEYCRLEGEARSRDALKLGAQMAAMVHAVTVAAAETGVDVTTTIEDDFSGFALDEDALPVRIARAAVVKAGLPVTIGNSGGGSDVNVFNSKGLASVNLGVGYEGIHSSAETMSLARLRDVVRLARTLVEAAGEITD